jgi:NTP pyrophosphatase (non-canonical NTP hydrolase)
VSATLAAVAGRALMSSEQVAFGAHRSRSVLTLVVLPMTQFNGDCLAVNEGTRRLSLVDLQELIRTMYSSKDEARGIEGTFMWLIEEIGELASSLREGTPEECASEFADVLAWLATIANVAGVDLESAVLQKYGDGCPGCGEMVCACDRQTKP